MSEVLPATRTMRRLPALARPRPPRPVELFDEVLDPGLRLLTLHRPGTQIVELRLSIPFASPPRPRPPATNNHPPTAF